MSDKRFEVICDFNVSENCKKKYTIGRKCYSATLKNNDGKIICMYCSRKLKYSGRKNPNCKYNVDENMFNTVDDEFKAYLLGLIASDGSITESSIAIYLNYKDRFLLEDIKNHIDKNIPLYYKKHNLRGIALNFKQIVKDVCRWLKINPGKKSDTIQFPTDLSEEMKWIFLRGYFDGDGCITNLYTKSRYPRASIGSNSRQMIEEIKQFVNIPCSISNSKCIAIEWNGINAIDFLGKIYNNSTFYLQRKYELFLEWCLWKPTVGNRNTKIFIDEELKYCFKFSKTRKDAVIPFKERVSDSGYDLTLLEKINEVGVISFYDTGIKIEPPYGYYCDLVPRSSIVKSGYMMANGFGVIDRSYMGNIIIPLIKVDPNAPELLLPNRLVQIIPREIVHFEIIEVSLEELQKTHRNEGGFGTTGD